MEEKEKELLSKVKQEATSAVVEEMKKHKSLSKDDVQGIIDEAVKGFKELKPEEITALKQDLGDLKNLAEKFNNFNKIEASNVKMDRNEAITKSILREGLGSELRKTYDRKSGVVKIFDSHPDEILKAVGNITTANATTDSGGIALLDMINAEFYREINLQVPVIEQFASVTRTSKPVLNVAEFVAGEGDAAVVAQGAAKPQLDLDIQNSQYSPIKVAGYQVFTEEAWDDIPRLQTAARDYLMRKVMLKRQDQILTIVQTAASAFDDASWTGDNLATSGAGDANLYDYIVAAASMIYGKTNYADEGLAYPNAVFLNPKDIANLRLKKTADGQYLYPMTSLQGTPAVDGIRVVATPQITAGYMLMGDFTKLNIVNYKDYRVELGWINDQFITNHFTMVGESRFYAYIEDLQARAFVYDTLANIRTAITTTAP